MADEAFALSPISARAAQPGEEDYEAISQAFMETSRGRWFLGEYAKRNRNADTRMVLDAVARIEQTLVEQKQPVAEDRLPEALAAIRSGVDEARAAAAAAIDGLSIEQHLVPVRKGIRVIKEISWRWREIGADARICDLIDSQLSAIEASCEQLASVDPKPALSEAFDRIAQRIAEFGGDGAPPAEIADPVAASTAPARAEPMPAPSDPTIAAVAASAEPEAGKVFPPAPSEPEAPTESEAVAEVAQPAVDALAVALEAAKPEVAEPEVAEIAAIAVDVTVEAAAMTAEQADETAEAADLADQATEAYDEAVLDLVALEMAAPDPSDATGTFDGDSDETGGAALAPGEPIMVPARAEPASQLLAAVQAALQPEPATPLQPSDQASAQAEASLGSSLIANGIVRRSNPSAADALAPIRRMSQAERIAFFS